MLLRTSKIASQQRKLTSALNFLTAIIRGLSQHWSQDNDTYKQDNETY